MPLPMAHGLIGASIVAGVRPASHRGLAPLIAGAFLANAADLDFGAVFLLDSGSLHRSFTHSLVFALAICSLLVVLFGMRQLRLALAYGLAYASHGLLDSIATRDGVGVALFWPFTTERFAFGWPGVSALPFRLSVLGLIESSIVEFLFFAPFLVFALCVRQLAPSIRGRNKAELIEPGLH